MSTKINNKTWNEALELYLPWIQRKARHMIRALPAHVANNLHDDMVGAGNRGLVEAMSRLDPDRPETMDTFIKRTITGAMLDELRSLDPLTRGQRRQAREFRETERSLTRKLGRPPTADEMAWTNNCSVSDYQEASAKHQLHMFSLNSPTNDNDDSYPELPDNSRADAFEVTLTLERSNLVRRTIRRLPTSCQKVVRDYYYEGKSLAEIGAGLNVCDARASQLRREGVMRLRSELVGRMAA